MPTINDSPKIAVAGVGGVGGYLSALLCRAFDSVTLVARKGRYDAFARNGLVLHSDLNGEVISRPQALVQSAGELPPQDYLFICVKNYSLEELLPQLKTAVTENTVIIPVMNGVDPGDRVQAGLSAGTVVKALIYIVAFSNPDYSITQQGNFADLRLGIEHPDESRKEKLAALSSLLTQAGIRHQLSGDIMLDIWKKYVLNCCYNVATAFYDCPIGPIRDDPAKARDYIALAQEAAQVAVAKGIAISSEDIEAIIDRFYHSYADEASSSLQRDIHAGRPAEVETFSGYIVKEAHRLGLAVPVSEKMYQGLVR